MKLDKRVTGGLAWAGLLLVVAVPAADLVTGRFAPQEVMSVEAEAAPPAEKAVTPKPIAVTPKPVAAAPRPKAEVQPPTAVASADPVDKYLESGKKLPAYLSDAAGGASPVQQKPEPQRVIPATGAMADAPPPPVKTPAQPATEVAALDRAALVAPIPMPASMRPRPPVRQQPLARVGQQRPAAPVIEPAPEPFLEGEFVADQLWYEDEVVSAEELEDWEYGPLSDFLANRRQQPAPAASGEFDADGFFLGDGPNY